MATVTHVSSTPSNAAMVLFDHAQGVYHKAHVQSLTRVSTTATAVIPGHQLETGDSVVISGADQAAYNGTFTVTKVDNDTVTFTVAGSPATPATGVITLSATDRSNIAVGCTGVQVEKPPSGTTLKIEKKIHPEASWVQEGTDITNASSTTIVLFTAPMGMVRVSRSAGSGDAKAYAFRG